MTDTNSRADIITEMDVALKDMGSASPLFGKIAACMKAALMDFLEDPVALAPIDLSVPDRHSLARNPEFKVAATLAMAQGEGMLPPLRIHDMAVGFKPRHHTDDPSDYVLSYIDTTIRQIRHGLEDLGLQTEHDVICAAEWARTAVGSMMEVGFVCKSIELLTEDDICSSDTPSQCCAAHSLQGQFRSSLSAATKALSHPPFELRPEVLIQTTSDSPSPWYTYPVVFRPDMPSRASYPSLKIQSPVHIVPPGLRTRSDPLITAHREAALGRNWSLAFESGRDHDTDTINRWEAWYCAKWHSPPKT